MTWCLFVYLSWYLDQETANESFRSSSQAATCYYQSNHSKVEAILLSTFPKDPQLANLPAHLHTIPWMLNVKQKCC